MSLPSEIIWRWKAARRQLDEAIYHYLESTSDLKAIPSDKLEALSAKGTENEDIWSQINEDSQSVSPKMQALERGLNVVRWVRNRSPSQVSISKIPSELLINIICLAVCKPRTQWGARFTCGSYHYDLPLLIGLSCVCSWWRALIVNESSFWTHITFRSDQWAKPDTLTWNLLQRSLERSLKQTLCITVPNSTSDTIQTGLQYLQPYSTNVKHIAFPNCYGYRSFIPQFFKNIGMLGLESLALAIEYSKDETWLVTGGQLFGLRPRDFDLESCPKLSQQELQSYLLPIRTLYLEGISFDWDNPTYHNLTSLTIKMIKRGTRPTTTEGIASVLLASPQLRTLCLRTDILPSDNNALPTKVLLQSLKYIDLRGVGTKAFLQLLPMLFLGPEKLYFATDIHLGSSCRAATTGFCARANITGIFLQNPFQFRGFRVAEGGFPDFSLMPNLEFLALSPATGSDECSGLVSAMTRMHPTVPNGYEAWCPRLRTLCVMRCELLIDDLEIITSTRAHPNLNDIQLMGCKFDLPAESLKDGWPTYARLSVLLHILRVILHGNNTFSSLFLRLNYE